MLDFCTKQLISSILKKLFLYLLSNAKIQITSSRESSVFIFFKAVRLSLLCLRPDKSEIRVRSLYLCGQPKQHVMLLLVVKLTLLLTALQLRHSLKASFEVLQSQKAGGPDMFTAVLDKPFQNDISSQSLHLQWIDTEGERGEK